MATTHKDLFYSKVMLLGEYSIILGSMGLTIPFSHFNGQLTFINKNSYTDLDFAKFSNQQLATYVSYLSLNRKTIESIINIEGLLTDVAQGLFFESTIPESYGLGSSGALVASIYSKYAQHRIDANVNLKPSELAQLKQAFASLESYFHGTSSGIDPLICYLNHPLCIQSDKTIVPVDLPLHSISNDDAIFLINTGKPGKTAPLVDGFMERVKDPNFFSLIQNQLIPSTNKCINHLLAGDVKALFEQLRILSDFQLCHFDAMIPQPIRPIWLDGLNQNLFTMKLCGSGGGGYALGFTHQFEKVRSYFKNIKVELIPVYHIQK